MITMGRQTLAGVLVDLFDTRLCHLMGLLGIAVLEELSNLVDACGCHGKGLLDALLSELDDRLEARRRGRRPFTIGGLVGNQERLGVVQFLHGRLEVGQAGSGKCS